jgi:hypothetical protein
MPSLEEIPMQRIFIALALLGGMTLTADAAAWTGAASLGAAAQDAAPISRVACDNSPQAYCEYGSYRVCRGYECWCAPCRTLQRPRYYSDDGPYYEDRRYAPRPRPGVQLYIPY